MDTGEDAGGGEGDEERPNFFPVSLHDLDTVCPPTSTSAMESAEGVSTLDFLETRTSTLIDRRFTDVLVGLEVASTSVNSDSGVDCLVSSSRIGDEEIQVKGEERREGDGDRDLERDVVRCVDRFGVGGIGTVGSGMMGDGVTSAVATGSSSQMSGMSA